VKALADIVFLEVCLIKPLFQSIGLTGVPDPVAEPDFAK
jgi:hypothetical protein